MRERRLWLEEEESAPSGREFLVMTMLPAQAIVSWEKGIAGERLETSVEGTGNEGIVVWETAVEENLDGEGNDDAMETFFEGIGEENGGMDSPLVDDDGRSDSSFLWIRDKGIEAGGTDCERTFASGFLLTNE